MGLGELKGEVMKALARSGGSVRTSPDPCCLCLIVEPKWNSVEVPAELPGTGTPRPDLSRRASDLEREAGPQSGGGSTAPLSRLAWLTCNFPMDHA